MIGVQRSSLALRLHNELMGCVVAAFRLNVDAVTPPVRFNDSDRRPLRHNGHYSSRGEEIANTATPERHHEAVYRSGARRIGNAEGDHRLSIQQTRTARLSFGLSHRQSAIFAAVSLILTQEQHGLDERRSLHVCKCRAESRVKAVGLLSGGEKASCNRAPLKSVAARGRALPRDLAVAEEAVGAHPKTSGALRRASSHLWSLRDPLVTNPARER